MGWRVNRIEVDWLNGAWCSDRVWQWREWWCEVRLLLVVCLEWGGLQCKCGVVSYPASLHTQQSSLLNVEWRLKQWLHIILEEDLLVAVFCPRVSETLFLCLNIIKTLFCRNGFLLRTKLLFRVDFSFKAGHLLLLEIQASKGETTCRLGSSSPKYVLTLCATSFRSTVCLRLQNPCPVVREETIYCPLWSLCALVWNIFECLALDKPVVQFQVWCLQSILIVIDWCHRALDSYSRVANKNSYTCVKSWDCAVRSW